MSRSVDKKIVQLDFDIRKFEEGIAKTMAGLGELKDKLNFKDGHKGISSLQKASRDFNMNEMGKNVDNISSRLSNMGIVGMTALQEITKWSMKTGKKLVGNLITPMIEGGKKRALNIQQAEFQFEGLGMNVAKAMENANYAVDGTAYGLDEAAMVASQLGASGMKAGDEMAQALLAVSGVAAMTGSSYEDIGRIFTTVAGNGRLMGNQLLQLGGKGLNAAAALAKSMDTTEQDIRERVSRGEISFEMFYKAMEEQFGEHAKKANDLYTGALANMKAAMARIGAKFYEPFLRNLIPFFIAMRGAIDAVSKALDPFINKLNDLIAKTLVFLSKRIESFTENLKRNNEAVENGVRDVSRFSRILDGLKTVIKIVANVLGALWKVMVNVTKVFIKILDPIISVVAFLSDLVVALYDARKTGEDIEPAWSGMFAIFESISTALGTLGEAFKSAFRPGERFRALGEGISKVWGGIKAGLSKVGELLGSIFKNIWGNIKKLDLFDIFKIASTATLLKALGSVKDGMGSFKKFWDKLMGKADSWVPKDLGGRIKSLLDGVGKAFNAFTDNIKAGSLIKVATAIAILSGSLLILGSLDPKQLAGGLAAITVLFVDLSVALKVFSETVGGKSIRRMGKTATTMIKMSIAISILAGAVTELSKIPYTSLAKGLGGLMVLMGILVTTSAAMSKSSKRFMKGSTGLIMLAAAIRILTKAVKELGSMDWRSLVKGLAGVMGVSIALAAFLKIADLDGLGLRKGAGLIMLAQSIKMLSTAVATFAGLDANSLIKGLGALGIVLLELAIFTKMTGDSKRVMRTASGLLILSVAIRVMSKAIGYLASINASSLAKGLGALAGMLVILAGAMRIMPKGMNSKAIALVNISIAMNILAAAVNKMGGMSLTQIAKGLGTLAGSLTILAVALHAMKGTVLASTSMLIMSTAIGLLVPSIYALGSLPVAKIAKALLALSGAFTVIGVAGLLLGPMVPALLGLSAALGLFGLSSLAVSAAIVAFSYAMNVLFNTMETLVDVVGKAVGGTAKFMYDLVAIIGNALIGITEGFIKLLPKIVPYVKELITQFTIGVIQILPVLMKAGADVLIAFLSGIEDNLYDVVTAATRVISAFMLTITEKIPTLIYLGANFMIAFLEALATHIPGVVRVVLDIVVSFITAITENLPKIIDAGFKVIIGFINGLAEAIRTNSKALWDAGANLISAIIEAVLYGIQEFFGLGKRIISNLVGGSNSDSSRVPTTLTNIVKKGITAIPKALGSLLGIGKDMVGRLARGISSSAGEIPKRMRNAVVSGVNAAKGRIAAFRNIGRDMMQGMIGGITSKAKAMANAAKNAASNAVKGVKNFLRIKSPSRVFMELGEFTGEGFAIGMESMNDDIEKSAISNGKTALDSLRDTLDGEIEGLDDPEIVITPVLDMSDIESGMSGIDGKDVSINADRSKRLSRSIDRGTSSSGSSEGVDGSSGGTYVFNQNNYSPKPLSRLDIYRNTKNQFATAKEVFENA